MDFSLLVTFVLIFTVNIKAARSDGSVKVKSEHDKDVEVLLSKLKDMLSGKREETKSKSQDLQELKKVLQNHRPLQREAWWETLIHFFWPDEDLDTWFDEDSSDSDDSSDIDNSDSCTYNNNPVCGTGVAYYKKDTSKVQTVADKLRSMLAELQLNGAKILNGLEARLQQFPFMCGLLFSGGSEPNCGCAVISSRFVLTAAHCLVGETTRSVKVRIGSLISSDTSEHTRSDIPAIALHMHENYDNDIVTNDIALVELKWPVDLDEDHVETLCLENTEFPAGTECIVAGWGLTKHEGESSDMLLYAPDIKILSPNDPACTSHGDLLDSQICARGAAYGSGVSVSDSCQGDSGGPLFCKIGGTDSNPKYAQAGIVSYGQKCGDPKVAGVYTKINKYICWINKIVNA